MDAVKQYAHTTYKHSNTSTAGNSTGQSAAFWQLLAECCYTSMDMRGPCTPAEHELAATWHCYNFLQLVRCDLLSAHARNQVALGRYIPLL
jgi:hypothetical protein